MKMKAGNTSASTASDDDKVRRKKMTENEKKESKLAKARIWSEAKREALPLSVGAVAMIASSAVNQRVPKLIGTLMDPLSSSSSKSTTTSSTATAIMKSSSSRESDDDRNLVWQIVWLGALGGAASLVRTYLLNTCQETIAARLRKEAFSTLLTDKDLEWFQHQSSSSSTTTTTSHSKSDSKSLSNGTQEDIDGVTKGDNPQEENGDKSSSVNDTSMTPAAIAVVIKDDVNTVASTVTNTFVNLLRSTSSCVFGTYNMLCINPQLVGLSLAVAPVVGAIALMTRKYIKKVVTVQQEAAVQAASFMEERLNHIGMVKMSNREQDEIDHYETLQDEYLRLGKKVALANGISMGVMFGLSSSALCGVLYAGRRAVIAGKMTSGQLTSFGTYSFMLALGSAGIIRAMTEYSKGIQCAVRLYRLTDATNTKNDDGIQHEGTKVTNIKIEKSKKFVAKPMLKETNSVDLNEISFSYKSFPSKMVLRNVSFRLSRGEVVVLVGKNGAGKSSIASLIGGLYSPQSGSILIENHLTSFNYLTDCDRSDQSQLVQVVPQHPALFDMSVLDNVKYARPDATPEEVNEALKVSNCLDFVSSLEGGLNYQVGRDGCRLSGGQRQKLGLARAFLSQPCFLVLDEPSASLDVEGETAVKDLLRACRTARQGVLVITHRAKTLELADRILVLKDGTIVEEGPPQYLQKKKNGELNALIPDLE